MLNFFGSRHLCSGAFWVACFWPVGAQVTVTHAAGDDYLVIENGDGAPAYEETAGAFAGTDTGQPDSWNGDRRWDNGGGVNTAAVWQFEGIPNGQYDVYASWRNVGGSLRGKRWPGDGD